MKRHLSFGSKLKLLVLLAAAGPLLLAVGMLLAHERRVLQRQFLSEASSVASLVAANTRAALAFGDTAAAGENLGALAAMPDLDAAAVYDAQGRLFASYARPGAAPHVLPAAAPRPGHRFEGVLLSLAHEVRVDGQAQGLVYLVSNATRSRAQLRERATVIVIVLVMSTAAVLLLASRMQHRLTQPVERLVAAARRVSDHKDYAVRVPEARDAELALLTRAFNDMLEQVERRDAEGQEKLNDILEHSSNLFFSHDPDGVLTFVSQQARAMLDCEPEEAMVHWTQFSTDNPLNHVALERTRQALATGQRQPPYELEIRTPRGRIVWVEVNEAPIVRDGAVMGLVGALSDITQRKRAEEERARLEVQFRQSQKMEAVGRLAGGVAHDFNNLLGVILGYAELLRRALPAGQKEERRVTEIVKAADRAVALTRQLLAFSRKQVLDPHVIDLAAVVADMEDMLRRLIREDVRLDLRKAEGLWTIKADRTQIEQVLLNLAVNARDAMPEGGVLTFGMDNVDTALTPVPEHPALARGRFVRLSVSDTGCGMDADTVSHVFEPFFTTKPKGQGTGLGLATVYGVVQQSGGTIDVFSAPGAGTTFTIYLPATEARQEPARPAPSVPSAGQGTVLVVEDEDALRRLTRELLEAHGYTVLDAAGGHEALGLLAAHGGPLHLLLTDVIMPGMSGRQLAERVSRQRPGTPILYMSGYTDDVIASHGVLDAGVALLEKPFSPEALLRKVGDAMRSVAAA